MPAIKKPAKPLTTSQAAAFLGVHPQTLRTWVRKGLVSCEVVNARGDRRFHLADLAAAVGETPPCLGREALYVRVSGSTGQESSLAAQEAELRSAAAGEVVAVFRDRASGLSVKRTGLRRLLDAAARREFDVVRVTHEDRLARFGVEWLSMLLEVHGVRLLVLHQREESSPHDELLGDFVSLVASFSGRIYGRRSAQARARLLREAA